MIKMYKFFIVFLASLLSINAVFSIQEGTLDFLTESNDYKYKTADDKEKISQKNFVQNYIEKIEDELELLISTLATVDLNSFFTEYIEPEIIQATWSNRKIRSLSSLLSAIMPSAPSYPLYAKSPNFTAPNETDWRENGSVQPVKNQKRKCHSWAFSAVGALESAMHIKYNQSEPLSEQNLLDCSWRQGNLGCLTGSPIQALQYVITNNGIEKASTYPYIGTKRFCQYKPENKGGNCTSIMQIPKGDEEALKNAVAEKGPVSVVIDASHRSFRSYKSGIYREKKCSSTRGLDYAVLVVGYGEQADGKKYWIVKNSQGTSFGQDGYIWMPRDENNYCGIASHAVLPVV